jgi:hypothetical protein
MRYTLENLADRCLSNHRPECRVVDRIVEDALITTMLFGWNC